MNFVRNAVLQLGTTAISIPLGILTSIVLARYLSVADRGSFALAMTFTAVVVMFSQFGWPSASIYRLRRIRSDPGQVSGAAVHAVVLSSGLAIAICLVFEEQLAERFLLGLPSGLYLVVLAMVPFQLLGLSFSGIARGIDRFALQNLYRLCLNGGNLAAAVVVLMLWDRALVEVLTAVLVVRIVAALWLTGSTVLRTGLRLRIESTEIRESLRFGLKSYVMSLAGQIHERVDLLMLAIFLVTPEEIAYYAIAVGVLQQIQFIPEAIGTALFPKLAGLTDSEVGAFAARVSRHSVAWVALTVPLVAIGGPLVLPLLYGEPYANSVTPFLVLLPGVAAITIYRVLGRFFLAQNRQSVNIWTQVTSTLANILLNVWLIPRHGILGAAISSLVSYSLEALMITVMFLRASGQNLPDTFVFRRADVTPYRERLRSLRRRLGSENHEPNSKSRRDP